MTILRGPRLLLTPLCAADLDALLALVTEPEVRRYLFDDQSISRDDCAALIEDSERTFAAEGVGLWTVREHGGALCGICGMYFFHLPPELQLVYALHPSVWGRGYATEAAQLVLDEAFRRGQTEIIASTDAPNSASVRVMERLGMRFEKEIVIAGRPTIYYRTQHQDES